MMNVDAKPWYPGCGHGAFPTDLSAPFASSDPAHHDLNTEGMVPFLQRHPSDDRPSCNRSDEASSPCEGELQSVASSASMRRNDPYRSVVTANHHSQLHSGANTHHSSVHRPMQSPTSSGSGVYDYSEDMYRCMVSRGLMDGPPSYHEFVTQPQSSGDASQPYRSAKLRRNHPTNIPVPCDAVDSDGHGASASASHSHSGGSSSVTPRQDKAVSIPLPRSRRPDSLPNSVVESPVCTNATVEDEKSFPATTIPASQPPVSPCDSVEEDSYLRCVSSAMRGPVPPLAMTVDLSAVEVLAHHSGLSVEEVSAATHTTRTQMGDARSSLSANELEGRLLTRIGTRCIPLAVDETPKKLPTTYAACVVLAGGAEPKQSTMSAVQEHRPPKRAPPAPSRQIALIADEEDLPTQKYSRLAAVPKEDKPATAAPQNQTAAKGKPTKAAPAKKKDPKTEWKTVEGKSGTSGKPKEHASTTVAAPTTASNKFELVPSHGKKKKSGKNQSTDPEANDDSCSDAEIQTAIVMAPSAPASHHAKKKNNGKHLANSDEAWLEEVAKAGAAAQEQQRNELTQQGFLKEPLLFMGFLRLVSYPTLGSLLQMSSKESESNSPNVMSPAVISAAELLLKTMREAAVDAIHGRINTIRRLLIKITKPQVVSVCPALVICAFVEACDACVDYDLGLSYVRQALHLARTHRLLALELLSMFVLSRHTQKLIDGTDCMEETQAALRLAMVLEEPFAIGWIAQTLAVYLELAGSFHESLRWHHFAHRVAKANGDARLETESLTHIAIATTAVGNMEEATELLNEADEKRKQLSRAASQRIVLNMTQVCAQSGDLERALQFHMEDRELAKGNGDAAQAATSSDSIATLRRSMGQLELSQQEHQEALQWIAQCPHTREVDCLLSLSATYKQLGHHGKARDVLLKVLRTARETGEQSTAAKCMAEIAECDGVEGHFQDAVCRLSEGLRLVDQTSPTDLKQYFIKVNLCEAEWKLLDVLEKIHFERGALLEAIRFGDVMRIPNTAEAMTMMQRRQRKALPNWPVGHVSATQQTTQIISKGGKAQPSRSTVAFTAAEGFLNQRFLDTALLDGLMNDKTLGGLDCMIVFSLRWDDDLDLTAYVVHGNRTTPTDPAAPPPADGSGLTVAGRRLRLTPELAQLLIGQRSALFHLFHSRHTDATGDEIYFDTPLFPQRFWYVQNKFSERNPEMSNRIANDPQCCLELLYDGLIRPLEDLFPKRLSDPVPAGASPPRVLLVGDGVISMIPFPALRNSHTGTSLIDRWVSLKLPSVQHALMIYAKRIARHSRPHESSSPVSTPSLVTGSEFVEGETHTLLTETLGRFESVVSLSSADEPQLPHQPSLKEISDIGAPASSSSTTVALAERLLASSTTVRQRHVQLSNALMRALTMDLPRHAPVILDLQVVPDVKEDFSGILTSSKGTMLATSADIAVTWDLSSMPLVVATQFGAYASRAVHETGIPIYRALLIAEAQRLLLPTGSSLQNIDSRSMEAVAAAVQGSLSMMADAATGLPADAMHEAMQKLKREGLPVQTWCAFSLYGLP